MTVAKEKQRAPDGKNRRREASNEAQSDPAHAAHQPAEAEPGRAIDPRPLG